MCSNTVNNISSNCFSLTTKIWGQCFTFLLQLPSSAFEIVQFTKKADIGRGLLSLSKWAQDKCLAKSSFKLEFLFSKCFYKIASSSIISTGISTAAVHSCSSCCLHNNIDERREANFLLLSFAIRTSHIKKPHYPAPIKHKNLHIKSLALSDIPQSK